MEIVRGLLDLVGGLLEFAFELAKFAGECFLALSALVLVMGCFLGISSWLSRRARQRCEKGGIHDWEVIECTREDTYKTEGPTSYLIYDQPTYTDYYSIMRYTLKCTKCDTTVRLDSERTLNEEYGNAGWLVERLKPRIPERVYSEA